MLEYIPDYSSLLINLFFANTILLFNIVVLSNILITKKKSIPTVLFILFLPFLVRLLFYMKFDMFLFS